MSTSILLNPATWDFLVDVNGNIALASEPYAISQDVACQAKLFSGELYYDDTQGVPYWLILSKLPSLQFIKNAYVVAALLVPSVKAAVCFITRINNRKMTGQIQTTDKNGNKSVIGF